MRAEIKEVTRPRTSVVNNRFPTSGDAIAYVGPAFGHSDLAPHLGLRCLAAGKQPVPVPAAPKPRPPKWHWHRITLGTGTGMLLTMHYYGFAGCMGFHCHLAPRSSGSKSLMDFDCKPTRFLTCDDRLTVDGMRITLKPRALALAVRWLEQRGIEVTPVEIDVPF